MELLYKLFARCAGGGTKEKRCEECDVGFGMLFLDGCEPA